jgi:hypothetical protein
MVMRFTGGAVGHKSTQDATKTFSQDSHELGDDRECEIGVQDVQEEMSSDPDVETEDFGAVEIGDRGGLGIIDEEDAEREEEIEYGYGMVDDEVECEDDPEDDADADSEGIDLGPEDGEECWEDDVLELEGYAAL